MSDSIILNKNRICLFILFYFIYLILTFTLNSTIVELFMLIYFIYLIIYFIISLQWIFYFNILIIFNEFEISCITINFIIIFLNRPIIILSNIN